MRSVTLLIAIVAALATVPPSHAEPMSYLDNCVIRLGVDLGKGGTITYLATSGPPRVNVVNSHDLGREVRCGFPRCQRRDIPGLRASCTLALTTQDTVPIRNQGLGWALRIVR